MRLLGGGLIPVVEQELAQVGIVMLALVTGTTIRHSLDQGATRQDVEDFPSELARPENITRCRLAPGRRGALSVRAIVGVRAIVEAEQLNVAQLELGEVGKNFLGELHSFVCRFLF